MAPTTQKALGVPSPKAGWKLYTDRPVPSPGPKEVLVKVMAVSINPFDAYVAKFGAPIEMEYPWFGGVDGAGVVEELGSEVTQFAKGDRVLFQGGSSRGTFCEYNVYLADFVAKFPDKYSFEQATTIPVALATVTAGLWPHHHEASSVGFPAPWDEGGLTKFAGEPAFITAGASSVGQFAIQMAKLQGFSPIITTASLRHEEFLKSIGAMHVIDRCLSDEVILAEVRKLAGKPIRYACDAMGYAETQPLAYDSLSPGGSLVLVQPFNREILASREERDKGSIKIARPLAVLEHPWHVEFGKQLYAHITEWLETGALVPNRIELFKNGLEGIKEASERVSNKQVSGVKLVVRVDETP